MIRIKTLLVICAMLCANQAAQAVTEKEMEEARATTARLYLRWANDGSGYLDEVKATTMGELNGKLRAKEKENLKAFNTAAKPGDYSKWTKEDLVKYWSETFFSQPGLSAKGKGAKSQVRRKLQSMTIAPPAKEQDKTTDKKDEKPADSEASATSAALDAAMQPTADTAMETQALPTADELELQADSIAAERAALAERRPAEKSNYTWVYVAILVALIGVVIFLVVYASKVMKTSESRKRRSEDIRREDHHDEAERNPEPRHTDGKYSGAGSHMTADDRERVATAAGMHNADAEKLAVLQSRADALASENRRLNNELNSARLRIRQLTDELSEARNAAATAAVAQRPSRQAGHATDTAASGNQPSAARRPRRNATVIYLGRVNRQGVFVRADRNLNPDHSVYELTTTDGYTGTYRVADDANVFERVLSDPEKYLIDGCDGEMLEDSEGCTTVVNEESGTAIFEDGCWRVLRKAVVAYE